MRLFKDSFPHNVICLTTNNARNFVVRNNNVYLDESDHKYLQDESGILLNGIRVVLQEHGNKVINDNVYSSVYPAIIEADALITERVNLGLAVRTADCLPIFISDVKLRKIAIVHSGWKGTYLQILRNTIETMVKDFGSSMNDLVLGFGPAIRKCCYEVKEDVAQYFNGFIVERDNKRFLDLILKNYHEARTLGIKENNIFDCSVCTCCNKDFFSFRREGKDAGRMLSLISMI